MANPKYLAATIGALAVFGGAAILLWPKKASAASGDGADGSSPLTPGDEPQEGTPVRPQNPQEAYGLAMNPKLTNPADVLALAQYLEQSGEHAWAASAQKRYYDLKAEELLSQGLKLSTSVDRVIELAKQLQSTHNDYAVILGSRVLVQRGEKEPPPPFNLQLLSGSGTLAIDMRIFAPAKPSAGGAPVSPSSGTTPSVSPTAPVPTVQPKPSTPGPGPLPSANQPVLVQPAGASQGAGALAAEETKPENDPSGTLKLAHLLIAEQAQKNWKYVSEAVSQWQAKVGLTKDGKFGPASALRMAREVTVLPWVRYWPTGSASKDAAVNDFRGRLKALALSLPKGQEEHAAALLIAAENEKGQGWPTKPAAAPVAKFSDAQLQQAVVMLQNMR